MGPSPSFGNPNPDFKEQQKSRYGSDSVLFSFKDRKTNHFKRNSKNFECVQRCCQEPLLFGDFVCSFSWPVLEVDQRLRVEFRWVEDSSEDRVAFVVKSPESSVELVLGHPSGQKGIQLANSVSESFLKKLEEVFFFLEERLVEWVVVEPEARQGPSPRELNNLARVLAVVHRHSGVGGNDCTANEPKSDGTSQLSSIAQSGLSEEGANLFR